VVVRSNLDRPDRLPHQQGTKRGEAGLPRRASQLGAPGPGLERTGRHCMQSPGKQREPNGVSMQRSKGGRDLLVFGVLLDGRLECLRMRCQFGHRE